MSALEERLKSGLQIFKDHGVNPLKLSYPLTLHPYGTFASPEELALYLLDLTGEEIEALIPILKVCQTFGNQYGEIDIFSQKPVEGEVETKEELMKLYKEFKTEAERIFFSLPPNLQKKILSRGKPKLRPRIASREAIRVFVSYDGEELSYVLYLNGDRDMLKIKASLMVSDLRDVATGEFMRF